MRTFLAVILGLGLSTAALADGPARPPSRGPSTDSHHDNGNHGDRNRDDGKHGDHGSHGDRDDDRGWDRDDDRGWDRDDRDWDRDRDDRDHDWRDNGGRQPGHHVYRGARPYDSHWRPAWRDNYRWVPAHYERGVLLYGYWEPSWSRPGYVWVPGYWNGYEYVDGYWRSAHRSGYRWSQGHYRHGAWVDGGWVRVYVNYHR